MNLWRISTVYVARPCPRCGDSRLTIQWIGRAGSTDSGQRLSAQPEFERRKCSHCDFKQIERLVPSLPSSAVPESA